MRTPSRPWLVAASLGAALQVVLGLIVSGIQLGPALAREDLFRLNEESALATVLSIVLGVFTLIVMFAVGMVFAYLTSRSDGIDVRRGVIGGGTAGCASAVPAFAVSALLALVAFVTLLSGNPMLPQGPVLLGAFGGTMIGALVGGLCTASMGAAAGALGGAIGGLLFRHP